MSYDFIFIYAIITIFNSHRVVFSYFLLREILDLIAIIIIPCHYKINNDNGKYSRNHSQWKIMKIPFYDC